MFPEKDKNTPATALKPSPLQNNPKLHSLGLLFLFPKGTQSLTKGEVMRYYKILLEEMENRRRQKGRQMMHR